MSDDDQDIDDEALIEEDLEVARRLRRHRGRITEVGHYERKRQFRLFLVKLLLSVIVVVFSLGMLAYNFNCETEATFIPLLSFILGVWMERPKA